MKSTFTVLFLVASTLATVACQHPNVPVASPGQNAKPLPMSPDCPSSCTPNGPLRNGPGH
jgi:hypothetical protein